MTPILFVLASFGFAFVVGYSKISLPLREWLAHISSLDLIANPTWAKVSTRWLLALLECPACVSFWLGFFATILAPTSIVSDTPILLSALFLGLANCGAVLALGMVTGLIKTE